MKLFICLSLLLNLVLIGVAGLRTHRPPPVTKDAAPLISHNSAPRSPERIARPRPGLARATKPWGWIEHSDPVQFISNLREIGCPETTISEIVAFKVAREFRARMLTEEAERMRGWDFTRERSMAEWNEVNERRRTMAEELSDNLEALLGKSSYALLPQLSGWPGPDEALDVIPREKISQVREIARRYSRMRQQIEQDSMLGNGPDLDALAELRRLEQERKAELAQILTPAELEELHYRTSAAAEWVLQNAPAAKSEAEFRAMVRAADEVQLTRTHFPSSPIPDTEETAAARQDEQERKNAFEQRLKEIVGEQRWVEQQVEEQLRAQAERARENQSGEERARAKLTEMAASIGVTANDAMRFMDRLQELGPVLGPKFEEFEKSLTGTPEEKRKQMQAVIRAEMEKVATEIVGDKGRALVEKLTQEERF